jgi:hypothetical protein
MRAPAKNAKNAISPSFTRPMDGVICLQRLDSQGLRTKNRSGFLICFLTLLLSVGGFSRVFASMLNALVA